MRNIPGRSLGIRIWSLRKPGDGDRVLKLVRVASYELNVKQLQSEHPRRQTKYKIEGKTHEDNFGETVRFLGLPQKSPEEFCVAVYYIGHDKVFT